MSDSFLHEQLFVHVRDVNPRMELHGEDNVLAADISLRLMMGDTGDEWDGAIRDLLAVGEDYDIDAVRPTQGSATLAELDFVAISVTHLQGAYTGEVFRDFRSLVPVATANHSIFIYDYSDDRVRTATSAALTRAAQNRRRK